MNNPEKLTKEEVLSKVKYLEGRIRISQINNGTSKFCQNRIKRVNLLKSYLK